MGAAGPVERMCARAEGPVESALADGGVNRSTHISPARRDSRFRTLLGDDAWNQLPPPIRCRFSKPLAPGEVHIYRGRVVTTELSRAGRVLAFVARAIGGPLPLVDGASGPAVVTVSEDARIGGQIWTRLYARPGRFPQVVHSAKRFTGATGLEEHIGSGVSMALRVTVEDSALVFRSERYLLALGRWRVGVPSWLSPGRMEIVHRQESEEEFSFRLTLAHPLLGRLIHQLGCFRDEGPAADSRPQY